MTEVIEKTEYKKGYKKTKLGWIPEDWEIKKIGDFFTLTSGITKPNDLHEIQGDKEFPVYGGNGIIGYSKQILLNQEVLIIGRVGEKCGCVHYLRPGYSCWITDNALYTNSIRKPFNYKYMYYLLQKINLNKYRNKGGQPLISQKPIYCTINAFPEIKEQEKIAEILSTWDDGIETLEKLIEQKKKSKKAMMQKLFLEKTSWQLIRFDKIFKDFCKKNCSNERLLSATQEKGVIPRDMLSGKVVSPEGSLDGYKLIEIGDFVISLRSFQGGLEYSKYRGILSPAYTVLKNIIDIDKDFYKHFFKSYKFIEKYLSISVIGIRDGKQISYSDLSSVKIPYPPLKEQRRTGEILNCYDKEIQLLNSKLEKLKEQKKGLMQKLLTGQIRVKI